MACHFTPWGLIMMAPPLQSSTRGRGLTRDFYNPITMEYSWAGIDAGPRSRSRFLSKHEKQYNYHGASLGRNRYESTFYIFLRHKARPWLCKHGSSFISQCFFLFCFVFPKATWYLKWLFKCVFLSYTEFRAPPLIFMAFSASKVVPNVKHSQISAGM